MTAATSPSLARHPGVDPSCTKCGQRGFEIRREGEHAAAVPCACVAARPCPACGGSGWVSAHDAGGKRLGLRQCACVAFKQRLARFSEVGLPGRLADRSFSNYRLTDTANQRDAFAAAASFARRYQPGEVNRGLVLWGPVGRGKTHLLTAMLRQIAMDHGVRARFIEFSHLLSTLKGRFDRGEGAAALLDDLVSVELLAIDELGKGMLTEFELATIDELVSRRYNAARTVIATTNYKPADATGVKRANLADPRAAAQPTLADRVGERVFSRLSEMCDFAWLGGDDHRRAGASP